ncbi:hypothetical protein SAMN05192533_101473 [Mesobacillus persicus]|uniref:Uncharacterized protein n=1 Tax=Mesobacillus persicus TaxID=930146 RepID=A0A1H7WM18_9BACI|nr:hypothetical protein [Mesobacillus persicus]SEM22028.1 hypothetical protein SAMN05192533_101473 [Mesobacillus persicus]
MTILVEDASVWALMEASATILVEDASVWASMEVFSDHTRGMNLSLGIDGGSQ